MTPTVGSFYGDGPPVYDYPGLPFTLLEKIGMSGQP
jgi:hypothetical protein